MNFEADGTLQLTWGEGQTFNNSFADIVTAAGNQLPAGTIADGKSCSGPRPAGSTSTHCKQEPQRPDGEPRSWPAPSPPTSSCSTYYASKTTTSPVRPWANAAPSWNTC